MSSPLVVVSGFQQFLKEPDTHVRFPPLLQHMTLISSRRSAQEPARLALVTWCYRTDALGSAQAAFVVTYLFTLD